MPTEAVLPDPLSGLEIKKAILDKVQIALQKDCHLNDNLAYTGGFSFKVHIEIHAQDIGRIVDSETNVNGAMRYDGERLEVADPEEYSALEKAESNIEGHLVDPTAARIETGQDVPTKITDKQGRDDIRSVRYRRDTLKK